MDAAAIGPDYLPAHAHGDIFSYELSLDGRRVVVDGGTSTYETGSERDWVRSTRAHNTVEIAGADQAEFFGAFRVGRRGRPRDVVARVSAEGIHVSGWHDGYRRLAGSPVHHRELELVAPGTLAVWDTVESTVAHEAVSRVRLAPGARVWLEGANAAAIEIEGLTLALHAFGGTLTTESGHYAPRFGERLPCPVLALHKGPGPEFGYVLARAGVAARIEPDRGRDRGAGHPASEPKAAARGRRFVRIALVSHYFWPETGAPSARLVEMGREWVARGHEVTVVTNFPNHPSGIVPEAYRGRSFQIEEAHGLRILRCRTYATPNRGFVKRTLGHLAFMVASVLQATPHLRGTDVIVASSPTLFAVVSALVISRRLRAPFVFEVRDLWPAIFVDLGVIRNRFVIAVLERLELFLYRRARAVVTVTRAFAENIAGRGIDRAKLHVIPNGVDLDAFRPGPTEDGLRARFGLADKLLVLYCGAHGMSHALSRILEVAARLQADPRIHFLFVGEGAEKDELVERARVLRLGNVTFRPAVPREEVPALYRAADVCLVPLRAVPLFRSFIPSKTVRDPRVRPAHPRVARGRGRGDPRGFGRGPRGAA